MFVHNGSWPYECPFCGRGFSKHNLLKSHMLIHTGNKTLLHASIIDESKAAFILIILAENFMITIKYNLKQLQPLTFSIRFDFCKYFTIPEGIDYLFFKQLIENVKRVSIHSNQFFTKIKSHQDVPLRKIVIIRHELSISTNQIASFTIINQQQVCKSTALISLPFGV